MYFVAGAIFIILNAYYVIRLFWYSTVILCNSLLLILIVNFYINVLKYLLYLSILSFIFLVL